MKVVKNEKSMERPLIPVGPQQAVIVDIIDLGTQDDEYEGKPTRKRELRIGFMFPEHTHIFDEAAGPQPLMKSIWVTLSGHIKSNLVKIVQDITGKPFPEEFEMGSLLGMNCLISVMHSEDGKKDKLASFMPLMSSQTPLIVEGKDMRFLDLDDFDQEVFLMLGENEQNKIKLSPEYTPF